MRRRWILFRPWFFLVLTLLNLWSEIVDPNWMQAVSIALGAWLTTEFFYDMGKYLRAERIRALIDELIASEKTDGDVQN